MSRDAPRDPVADLIAEFNHRYMVVNEAGRAIIYEPGVDPMLKREMFVRLEFGDFRKLYMNRLICVGLDDKKRPVMQPVADVWLKHPDRREYVGGVIFDPAGRHVKDGTLNLWRGFSIPPAPGSWTRLRDHILNVICAGDRGHFDYVIGWMARLVQHPDQQGETAIVMRGGEGTGKGTLARALLHILGQHGLTISNAKHLTGNFNGHLHDCIFLFADEAFYAGDKQHVGVLKALITEPSLTIESKYKNPVQMPNFVHLMMASNEQWVVPAALDARRFFVLEVTDERKNDHAYFAAIWGEMANGGYEAMLHDLLEYDLTFFNVRAVPVTRGLQTQRSLSLGTSDAWWRDVLWRGYVYKSKLGLESYFNQWFDVVATEVLFASYEEYAQKRHDRHPMNRETFGRFMRETAGAKGVRPQKVVVGEHVTDVTNPFGGTSRKAVLHEQERAMGYHLGGLELARRDFCKRTGLAAEWPAEDAPSG